MKKYKPIVVILYDPETGNIHAETPDNAEPVFRKKHEDICRELEDLWRLCERSLWPRFMSDEPWAHLYPVNDLIKHNLTSCECACNPEIWDEAREVYHCALDPNIKPYSIGQEPGWTFFDPNKKDEDDQ